jgi:hypothetical protein
MPEFEASLADLEAVIPHASADTVELKKTDRYRNLNAPRRLARICALTQVKLG